MPRMTKAFSFEKADHKWFKMMEREADRRRPKVTQSQMMVEIIRDYFERKKIVDDINRNSLQEVSNA